MKQSPRVLLLLDWLPEKGSLLFDSLRKNGLNCDAMGIDFHQSKWTPANKILSHWPRSFWISVKAFRRRHDYDYVIARQQVVGMFLGLFKLLFFTRSPKVFILIATIVERENIFTETLRRAFIALSYRKVDHIGFVSNGYRCVVQQKFHLSETQAVHLKLPLDLKKIPDYSGFRPDGYLFSMGLSYRDYRTLMEAAKKTARPFVVATLDPYVKDLEIPDNVTVYRDAFGQKADELMEQSAAVILPLDRVGSPAGETVLLRAMCYGKPVIITKTIVTEEYIQNGQNGFLVPWKDADAIVDAIKSLFSSPLQADAIGRQARKSVLENHSMDDCAINIIRIIERNA
jgi:glycosyltransferase involved in cell wall biosynthesis